MKPLDSPLTYIRTGSRGKDRRGIERVVVERWNHESEGSLREEV